MNEGVLLVNKPRGKTSFSLVYALRRLSQIKKIGHAGTLDPFATGVMILLIGKKFTRLSDHFLHHDKEYVAKVHLGVETDTYDCEGRILLETSLIPSLEEIQRTLQNFQGKILQTPPMFSAKKVQGKKLYELARKGLEIPRVAAPIELETQLISYTYPYLELKIRCSKGTYIRSIAHDLGKELGTGAHLSELVRTRSGPYHLDQCLDGTLLNTPHFPYFESLITSI